MERCRFDDRERWNIVIMIRGDVKTAGNIKILYLNMQCRTSVTFKPLPNEFTPLSHMSLAHCYSVCLLSLSGIRRSTKTTL